MGRLSKRDMEELREFCSLGCEYSGTEEIVNDLTGEVLAELGAVCSADEISIHEDGFGNICTLDVFVRAFWEKAAEKILNVVETQRC